MSALPLCSSAQVVATLKRLGFTKANSARGGSHQAYWREKDGAKHVTVIVLAQKEIPRGTLKSILDLGGISDDEFLDNLK